MRSLLFINVLCSVSLFFEYNFNRALNSRSLCLRQEKKKTIAGDEINHKRCTTNQDALYLSRSRPVTVGNDKWYYK